VLQTTYAGGLELKLTDLHDELKAIIRDRALTHGDLENTFEIMAQRWSQVLEMDITPAQTAWMMAEAKLARMESGGYQRDHLLDAANYLIISAYLNEVELGAILDEEEK